uniref:Uncharacterized protein n=1 Tax=Megaselia scalaris TaxID=36166 RepID=T1GT88_MEGSC
MPYMLATSSAWSTEQTSSRLIASPWSNSVINTPEPVPSDVFDPSVNIEISPGVTTLPCFQLSLRYYDVGDEVRIVLLSDIVSIRFGGECRLG